MLRSTEAIMAGLLIIFTVSTLYKIPEVEVEDPVKAYTASLLDAYSNISQELVFRDPYSLKLLLEAALPYAYSSRLSVNIYKKVSIITGTNLTSGGYHLPVEYYEVLPTNARTNIEGFEVVDNWYQAVFTVTNEGNRTVEGESIGVTVAIYKSDINGDGIPEPIDPESIMVFTEDGKADFSVESIEDYPDRIRVSLKVKMDRIEPGEKKHIYVLYMLGDDYE